MYKFLCFTLCCCLLFLCGLAFSFFVSFLIRLSLLTGLGSSFLPFNSYFLYKKTKKRLIKICKYQDIYDMIQSFLNGIVHIYAIDLTCDQMILFYQVQLMPKGIIGSYHLPGLVFCTHFGTCLFGCTLKNFNLRINFKYKTQNL